MALSALTLTRIVFSDSRCMRQNTTANELYIDSRNFADFKNADGVAWGGFVREDPAATVTYYVRGFTADGNAYPSEGNAYQSSIPAHIPVVSQSLPPTNISMHAKNAPSSLACEDRKVGVTVKWSRPVDQGMGTDPMYRNSPLAVIVNYLVEISSSQDFSGEAAAIVSTGTNTTVTVMGLKEGTIYYARITPETSAGNGVTSDVTAGVAASEVPCDAVQVILGGEVLPKQEYAQCRIYATWEDFWYCHDGGLCPYKTGELEKKLSEKGVVERWVCYNHPCGGEPPFLLSSLPSLRFCLQCFHVGGRC